MHIRTEDSAQTMRSAPTTPMHWAVRVVVLLGALLTAMGAVIALAQPAMLVSPHAEISEAVRIYAGYLAARNLAIGAALLALFLLGARRALGQLMVLVGTIQLLDAAIDVAEGRWIVAPGVLVLGIVFLATAKAAAGAGFWRLEAWRS